MKRLHLKNLLKISLLIFILGILVIVLTFPNSKISKTPVRLMEAQYAADFTDDKVLVGASHNIFIGKVIAQVGTQERGIGPETQFSVQVVENIKGELNDTVIVNQEGGYKEGLLYVFSEENHNSSTTKESYLLQPGSTYIFLTRYNKEENWHTMNPYPTANKLLHSGDNLPDSQLRALAENDPRVQALKAAYPDEVLIDADVKNNKTLNSYKSLQEKQIPSTEEKAIIDAPAKEETNPENTVPQGDINTPKSDSASQVTLPEGNSESLNP